MSTLKTSGGDNNGDLYLFSSESVGEGHPDKMCDQVSDAILDALLEQDPYAKVACECFTKTGMILVGGEISTVAEINYVQVVRDVIQYIGYDDSEKGFDYKTCNVMLAVEKQSGDIAQGVHQDRSDEDIGAGDQGFMFGYATDETEECLPMTVVLAHALNKRLAECRRNGTLPWLRPDTKTQVTIQYRDEHGAAVPVHIHTVVISTQHDEDVSQKQLQSDVMKHIVKPVLPKHLWDDKTIFHINPSGRFVLGGPLSDAGLTGRKIIVDTYGGWGAHGGGAFSGKDFSKVDRSGAYAARWVAKSLLKAGLCRRVLVQVSYAIGIAKPLAIYVNSYGTSKLSNSELLNIVNKNFDLRPGHIVNELNLRRPIYLETARYGHFGNPNFPWEQPKKLIL